MAIAAEEVMKAASASDEAEAGATALVNQDIFHWPIVTDEDKAAVLAVLDAGNLSGNNITLELEKEVARWTGRGYALAYPNGTESLRAAMWACGVGAGDEIICPSMTYWASGLQALSLGAAVNFADISRQTLCIDPDDIEHRIGPRTKALVVVHYAGHPCDMDAILPIARKHNLKVIEDVSHAQGGTYQGRMTATFGDVACMSIMAGKSLACGEGGLLVTDDRAVYERCIAYGFYERTDQGASCWAGGAPGITDPELQRFAGLPIGGYKHRINQTCSAMARVQLKHYPERMAEIQRSMNFFWDLLEDVPGTRAHRPTRESGSTMGGWYSPLGLYREEELGVSCAQFCEAVNAEGTPTSPGGNAALHLHPVFHEADLFRQGRPTMVAFGQRDVRQGPGSLPVSESIRDITFHVPWFKRYRPEIIEQYAAPFRKVAERLCS